MARVLVVAGPGLMGSVPGMGVLNRLGRSGRGMRGVRLLKVRVSHRGRSVMPLRRLEMFMWNTRVGRPWFGVIVMRRMRLVSMRSILTRHASPSS